MSDPYEDYMGFRRGENEPAPEEPAAFGGGGDSLPLANAPEASGGLQKQPQGRYDSESAVAESLAKRDNLQRQIDGNMANARMLLDAIWGNFKDR